MIPTLKLSQALIDKLSTAREPCFGKLYGVFFENTITLIAVQIETNISNVIEYCFPTEVDLFGLIALGNDIQDSDILSKLRDIDITDNPIFVSWCIEENSFVTYFVINNRLEKRPHTIISEQEVYQQYVHVRLRSQFIVTCDASEESIKDSLADLRSSTASGKIAFNFPRTQVYLLGADNGIENSLIGIAGEPNVGEICEHSNELNEGVGRKKRNLELNVLDINMFQKVTKDHANNDKKEHAPICIISKKQRTTINIPVKIDALALINKQTKLNRLYEILIESIVKNIKFYQNALLHHFNESEEPKQPEIFHFYPNECGHFVTLWLVKDADQQLLEPHRRILHNQFMLSMDRPLFRKSNRYIFKGDTPEGSPLINPHENVKNTQNDGQIALVKGRYSYYHYCQNKMDDDGWGCAYRSLQTLASWFKWQGYTEKDVPSFEDIQKCLVDIGDKPSAFIGSKQWIGSTEVSFVLDTLLGVTCKILHVTSGDEMAYKGPELVRHFEEYGSPVMIGGGVLAHTILGVDYNHTTGNIKFLILDPHYTGSEDLQLIQSKGWCGWKGIDFWKKSSYYNMCLPLVPTGI